MKVQSRKTIAVKDAAGHDARDSHGEVCGKFSTVAVRKHPLCFSPTTNGETCPTSTHVTRVASGVSSIELKAQVGIKMLDSSQYAIPRDKECVWGFGIEKSKAAVSVHPPRAGAL